MATSLALEVVSTDAHRLGLKHSQATSLEEKKWPETRPGSTVWIIQYIQSTDTYSILQVPYTVLNIGIVFFNPQGLIVSIFFA